MAQQMENIVKLPKDLCNRIFQCQFEIDVGNISELMITKTVQLYVEAISAYTILIAKYSQSQDFDLASAVRGNQFYQDKIKRLLARSDVQQILGGKRKTCRGLDLQKQISKMKENAPEQARSLISYFKQHIQQQQNIVQQSIACQTHVLQQRIQRRSKSKSIKKVQPGYEKISKPVKSTLLSQF